MDKIEIKNLSFKYPTGNRLALNNVSITINKGDFAVVFGPSGCGKSTLLKQIIKSEKRLSVGFVGQNPEDGIVTDKVWHELAFGLENYGVDSEEIRRRVAEISQFFGIQTWFHKETYTLSGGQKQILNLASAMTMQPDLLLLDEPMSQLDPIASVEFLAMVNRIHRELGTTILMVEHRLEEVLEYCNYMYYMKDGQIVSEGEPDTVISFCAKSDKEAVLAMPASIRVALAVGDKELPHNTNDGRVWLENYINNKGISVDWQPVKASKLAQEALVSMKDVRFRYEKRGEDILRGLSFDICRGEVLAMLGGNGSGKTTALSILLGINKPYAGKVTKADKDLRIAYVPQNPQTLFITDTVEEELTSIYDESILHLNKKVAEGIDNEKLNQVINLCDLSDCMARHPYDLSGGEQQKLALAKILLTEPDVLLLDEPTKGLDANYKRRFADILSELKAKGMAILMVSHDTSFCAENSDRCMLLFDGECATMSEPRSFFTDNYFYTTPASRMSRGYIQSAVTVEDIIEALGGNKEKTSGGIGKSVDASKKNNSGEKPGDVNNSKSIVSEAVKEEPDSVKLVKPLDNKVRNLIMVITILGLIPFTIYFGVKFLHDERFLFISLLLILECMVPFFLRYENRKPTTQDSVLLAVLCALAVIGRTIFAALPQVKPVTAITIIAGATYGAEAGFLVGASSMLISNIIFGQGPWTPWQMFAMGCIGLVSGLLFHGLVKRLNKLEEQDGNKSIDYHTQNKKRRGRKIVLLAGLCVFGFLAPVIIYGGIMDPSTVVLAGMDINIESIRLVLISGFPFNVVHGISTVVFLMALAIPMIEKLHRVTLKYSEY